MYDLIPKNSEDWNNFLRKKYGYDIMNFARCIAELIQESDLKYQRSPNTKFARASIYGVREHLKREADKIEKLKAKNIKMLYELFYDVGQLEKGGPTKRDLDFIFDIYPEAKSFIKRLDKIIKDRKDMKSPKKGAPVKIYNKIAFVFAQVMRDKKGISWQCIEKFLKWFFKELSTTDYYKILGYGDLKISSIKREYYRMIRNKESKSKIRALQKRFFPKPHFFFPIAIEFNKNYIEINMVEVNPPYIKFPNGDGIIYQTSKPYKDLTEKQQTVPQLKSKAIVEVDGRQIVLYLTAEDIRQHNKVKRIRS